MAKQDETQTNSPEPKSEDKVVQEARERAQAFQEAYKKLCDEFKCSHKAILNASTDGIVPSFVITISKEQEEKPEEKSAEKAE